MTYPDKQKAEILMALHRVLQARPKDSVPHPSDLAKALAKRGEKPTRDALLSVVSEDIEYKKGRGKNQIFSFKSTYGYTAIVLTEHGQSITPDLSYFYLLKPLPPEFDSQGYLRKKAYSSSYSGLTGDIRDRLSSMEPYEFEGLVERTLSAMGVQNLERTPQSRDSGIDIRGTLILEGTIHIKIAVQVKRYGASIGSPEIQKLRGSLSNGEVGWFVTLSRFTPAALAEAEAPQRQPISLIDGGKLIDLIEKYRIAVS